MSKKKNFYAEKYKKKSLQGIESATAKKGGSYKLSHLIIGGIGGGLTGIVTGKASLLAGLAVTGAGAYLNNPTATMFGVGLMATGGYQTASGTLNGPPKEGLEGLKERFTSFKTNISRQLFLDKLLPKKKNTGETTNGLNEVQYFSHPGSNGGLDFSDVNRIERQINESAQQFEARQMNGTDGVDGLEERLY